MRILFTFAGGSGHFLPLVGIARAASQTGHEVLFGCRPSMVEVVRSAGFDVEPLGTGVAKAPERMPLRPLDAEREVREFIEGFVGEPARRRFGFTTELVSQWKPDMLVCDETDFGSKVAAEVTGIRFAEVIALAAGSFAPAPVLVEPLRELKRFAGLDSVHGKGLVLAPIPPSYRDPAFPLPSGTLFFRQPVEQSDSLSISKLFPSTPGWPIVYFTLGTVFNLESGDLFNRVLSGLRNLPINLLVTVGNHLDPQEFGDQPANVSIHRFLPQDQILPHCSLVVSHAGSGSTLGALANGLPMVAIPLGADQLANAERCRVLGCAKVEDPIALTPDSIRSAVQEVLENPSYRQVAQSLAAEYQGLPDVSAVVRRLERL